MNQFETYVLLLCVIVFVGMLTRRVPAPPALLIVIAGMLFSFVPDFPPVNLDPQLVFTIFLPLLVYEATAYTSWPDIKFNRRSISLLSIGHVIFITVLVAIAAHQVIPGITWPLAFVLGSIISPPDDVAIFAIAEKVRFPQRILTILTGEGLLNDATALILFRFSLIAVLTNQFSLLQAVSDFFAILVCETLYGFVLGHLLGQIRTKLHEPMLQMLLSIVTPFLAYLPAEHLGGSGVLAVVVTGLVITHVYAERFMPEARLLWSSVWKTIGFTLQSILFLLVGLNLRSTLNNITSIPTRDLMLYSIVITAVVIAGRFIWVYPSAYLPGLLFPSIRKQDPHPPWQYPFVISWAGMRGGISLAAALAIPHMMIVNTQGKEDIRAIIIFLVFCVIIATLLLQGLTLPWLMRVLGVDKMGQKEADSDHVNQLTAKADMADAALNWLYDYKQSIKDDPDTFEHVELQIMEYQRLKKQLSKMIMNHDQAWLSKVYDTSPTIFIFTQLIEVERETLMRLWRERKISFKVKNKLLEQLDLRYKHFSG
ncbi:Na+/H+ antiporter [Aquicella lusitana]|uniref:Sodium/proton antiporter (CPA1 family) n=1 Tax=Aquicella lusitana TaxID=254246 RepID=A0A370GJG4_9COXI|nr:Na+/H+ antiporter [Aquicella lusitana]RDI43376.1 sodium/proton antiporter (CPA1 family) [Aquicella lusitana]VVC73526.1 Sodium, potassium, lithium and rubidium/H(+) antiporter [Aquicella lusitana]